MSTTSKPTAPTTQSTTATNMGPSSGPEKSYFDSQREILVGEIAQSLEHVLQNINKLNRSLEEVIAVGLEFSPVEALWSQFEGVMAREGEEESGGAGQQAQSGQQKGTGGREARAEGEDGE